MRTILCLLIAVLPIVALGDERPPKPPELKVLERFVGTWDCETVMKPAVWTPKEVREKTVEVNELVMDGWYLQGSSRTQGGKFQAHLMNTYDPDQKKFRTWKFTPGGRCEELIGQWNEATSTLTITSDLGNGITSRADFHLIDKDHREYDVVAKDGDGKLYLDIHGTVTRQGGTGK